MRYASIWRRLTAFGIDCALVFGVAVAGLQLAILAPLRHRVIGSDEWLRQHSYTDVVRSEPGVSDGVCRGRCSGSRVRDHYAAFTRQARASRLTCWDDRGTEKLTTGEACRYGSYTKGSACGADGRARAGDARRARLPDVAD